MNSGFIVALALTAVSVAAHSAPKTEPPPANPAPDVKVISVPTGQPTEVKIISLPALTPVEVKIVSQPTDDSGHAMVQLTEWLVGANILLCAVTVWSTLKQGRDQKRRDLAAMRREVARSVANVSITATRLGQMAEEVPQVRSHLHVLIGQGGMPTTVKTETDDALAARRARLKKITDQSLDIVFGEAVTTASESDLTRHLWQLDAFKEQLDGMRDAITSEIDGYQREALTIRQAKTTMEAAALGAKLGTPRSQSESWRGD